MPETPEMPAMPESAVIASRRAAGPLQECALHPRPVWAGNIRGDKGESGDEPIANIVEICEATTGCHSLVVGSMNHEVDFNSAVAFPQNFPAGTILAIDQSDGRSFGDGRFRMTFRVVLVNGRPQPAQEAFAFDGLVHSKWSRS